MAAIYRGTTPTIRIKIPVQQEFVSNINVSINQFDIIVIERHQVNIEKDADDSIWAAVTLSQAETLLLNSGTMAIMQLRFRDIGGYAFASQAWQIEIKEIVKDGEI